MAENNVKIRDRDWLGLSLAIKVLRGGSVWQTDRQNDRTVARDAYASRFCSILEGVEAKCYCLSEWVSDEARSWDAYASRKSVYMFLDIHRRSRGYTFKNFEVRIDLNVVFEVLLPINYKYLCPYRIFWCISSLYLYDSVYTPPNNFM